MGKRLSKDKELEIKEFLKSNPDYEKLGIGNVIKLLGISEQTLSRRAKQYGVFTPRGPLRVQLESVASRIDMSNFLPEVRTPEAAYFLGQMWTDGHISHGNGKSDRYFSLYQEKSDFLSVRHVYEKIGEFAYTDRKIQINKGKINSIRMAHGLYSYHKGVYDFLSSLGFKEKSGGSMGKLLGAVPTHLKKFLLRGLIDGDGCIYCGTNNKGVTKISLGISSVIYQDWAALQEYLNSIGTLCSISKNIVGNGGSSTLMVAGPMQLEKLLDFVYQGYDDDKIGFPRKHSKYLEIKSHRATIGVASRAYIKASSKGIEVKAKRDTWKIFSSLHEASRKTGINRGTLKRMANEKYVTRSGERAKWA